jgi:predicted dehydrogenase
MVIRVALIGYGYWGPNHARVFNELPNCKLVYICDKQNAKLQKAKQKYPNLKFTTDYRVIKKDNSIDAVVIATPVSTHYLLAKEFLTSGKHVLVEKPMTNNLEYANELLSLSLKMKKLLMVGHIFLYNPAVIKIKKLIDNKYFGKLYYIDSTRINLGLFQPDVSVIWDLAAHDVSTICFWLNSAPKAVGAVGKCYIRKNIEEVAYLTLFFDENILSHIHVSWLAPVKLRKTIIVGKKRMAVYDDTEVAEKVKIYNCGVVKNPETFGEFQLTYRSGDIISPKVEPLEPLKLECSEFIQCIENNKTNHFTAINGLKVVKILSAAEKSLQSSGKVVELSDV